MKAKKPIIIVALLTVAIIVFISNYNSDHFISDDLFYGSFRIADEEIHSTPVDFLVSVGASDTTIQERIIEESAIEHKVNINDGDWVYSYGDSRIYSAEKKDNKVYVFDNNEVIGVFECKTNKYIYLNVKYIVKWKDSCWNLDKVSKVLCF